MNWGPPPTPWGWVQIGCLIAFTISVSIYTHWLVTHPQDFEDGWNACVKAVNEQNAQVAAMYPVWKLNVSIGSTAPSNTSGIPSHTSASP